MKDDLQGKLVEILSSIQAAAGKAGDFALAQLPDIAQSYVMYGRVVSLVQALVMIVLGVSLICGSIWAYRHPWNASRYSFEAHLVRSDSNLIAMVGGGGAGVLVLIVALTCFDWMVWFAPKVWLLKQIAMLVR